MKHLLKRINWIVLHFCDVSRVIKALSCGPQVVCQTPLKGIMLGGKNPFISIITTCRLDNGYNVYTSDF